MPSPTNITEPNDLSIISESFSTLSDGRSSEYTVSIPSSSPIFSATAFLSPESITVFFMPADLRAAIADFESSFILSDIIIYPAYLPSTDVWITVPKLSQSIYSQPTSSISLAFPANTIFPSTTAFTPRPDSSSVSDTLPVSS